jgi:hypothetical protein
VSQNKKQDAKSIKNSLANIKTDPATGFSALSTNKRSRARLNPSGSPPDSDNSDNDSDSDSSSNHSHNSQTRRHKKKVKKAKKANKKAKTAANAAITPTTPSMTPENANAFAIYSGNVALVNALHKIVSDKKPSLAKRIFSYMEKDGKINSRERKHFFSYFETQTFTTKEVCKLIRSVYSGNANKQIIFENILKLKDDEFISFITFDWVAQFGTIDEVGFKLTSLFHSSISSTDFTIGDLFTAFDLAIRYLCELYSSTFDILRVALLEPLRFHGNRYPAQVLHDQLSCAIRNLSIVEPLPEHEFEPFIETWTKMWIIKSSKSHFLVMTDMAKEDYTMSQIKGLQSKASTKSDPKPQINKSGKKGTKPTFSTTKTTKSDNKPTTAKPWHDVDMKGLEGYCFSAPIDKECRRKSKGKQCDLKHADEFKKLSASKQAQILAAYKVASKLMKEQREAKAAAAMASNT